MFRNVRLGVSWLSFLMPGFSEAFIVASHAVEERSDLKSIDKTSSTHNMIYSHQEPCSRSSADVSEATRRKRQRQRKRDSLPSLLISDKKKPDIFPRTFYRPLHVVCKGAKRIAGWGGDEQMKKGKKQREITGKKKNQTNSKTIQHWHTKGVSGLRENRLQRRKCLQPGAPCSPNWCQQLDLKSEENQQLKSDISWKRLQTWATSVSNTDCRESLTSGSSSFHLLKEQFSSFENMWFLCPVHLENKIDIMLLSRKYINMNLMVSLARRLRALSNS